MQECERIVVSVLPVLGEPAAAVQPGDGSLDDPTLRLHDEAPCVVAAFDDLNPKVRHHVGGSVPKHRPGIGAVGKQLAKERKLPKQRGQQQDAAIAVLHVGGGHQRMQKETELVDEDVALLAFDQLAGIEPMRIDVGPPFSALFTLWLSTIQAVGLASCMACSRHFTYSA